MIPMAQPAKSLSSLRRDIERRHNGLPAHLQPAFMLGSGKKRQLFIDTAQACRTRNHAELSAHLMGYAPFGEFPGKRLRDDYRLIFPAPVFTIHGITVPHPEIIQVDGQRGVVY